MFFIIDLGFKCFECVSLNQHQTDDVTLIEIKI